MTFEITPIFVAIFLIFGIAIAFPIGPLRGKVDINFWGGEPKLDRLVRGHGNFIEYVPFALIGMATAELVGTPPSFLIGAGVILLVARVVHYFGLQVSGVGPARLIGTVATMLITLSLACAILWRFIA